MSKLFLLYLLICTLSKPVNLLPNQLSTIVNALNLGLRTKTNIIYTKLQEEEITDVYTGVINEMPTVLFNYKYFGNLPNVSQVLYKPFLVILPQPNEENLKVFNELPTVMQDADFMFVGQQTARNWLQLLSQLWKMGYPNLLIYNESERMDTLYTSQDYPLQKLIETNVSHYLWARQHWFDNLHGLEVRVALYNNPPRTLVYPKLNPYDGYALMLLRQFLAYRKAKFVPVLTPDYEVYSANDCLKYLQLNQSDLCGDLLAYSPNYSFSASYMYLYGNILIPNSLPRSKNFYIIAPFELITWFSLAIYLLMIASFASFIYWLQTRRNLNEITQIFGKFVLQILSSLLYAGFQLKDLAGKVHYILFGTIFLTGFIISTFYLASLKSILATGLYEPQINTFEELVKRNISFIIGDYDKTVLEAYDFPDILWNITHVVPYQFILDHRRIFDTNYAYLAHSDRLVLFRFQQQFMTKPRMRPLPIELMHSLPGFPMRREWLLRNKLSQTLLNSFGSGLMEKLASDTNRQTIHIGYLNLIKSEPYEAQSLKLDYFAVPLFMLVIGLLLAFICFMGELLWHHSI